MPHSRPVRAFLLAVAVAATLLGPAGARADAPQTLRFATLAPKNSSWGKLFRVWQEVVKKKTEGRLEVHVYFNAVQGDEEAMVAKLKSGQLDGASLSSTGLAHIERDVGVMQLPGVVNSWELLDMVRELVGPRLEKEFDQKGLTILGWGDVGLVHQMSKGAPIRAPDDLKGRRPAVWRNEPVGPILYSLIGGVVPVPTSVLEVLPQLRSRSIDVLAAPSLAAEQLQWTPFLDHLNENVVVCAAGATVVRRAKLEALPGDVRAVLVKLQKRYEKVNGNRIRKLDHAAHERLRAKMTLVTPSTADKVEWYRLWLRAVGRMRSGIYTQSLIDEVLRATGKG